MYWIVHLQFSFDPSPPVFIMVCVGVWVCGLECETASATCVFIINHKTSLMFVTVTERMSAK